MIGKFSKAIGISIEILRLWNKQGKLKPEKIKENGYRYYSQKQIDEYLGVKIPSSRIVIGYCRVSLHKQNDDLERQIENVKTYMIAKKYQFKIIKDIGSGINYNKKGLLKLLEKIQKYEIEKVVILYKDRLLGFGFELVENICNRYQT